MTETPVTGPGTVDSPRAVVSAAKEHAASIRRTLWIKESKRLYGSRGVTPTTTDTSTRQYDPTADGTRRQRGGDGDDPPIIDGPLYSPEYWRGWRDRVQANKVNRVLR